MFIWTIGLWPFAFEVCIKWSYVPSKFQICSWVALAIEKKEVTDLPVASLVIRRLEGEFPPEQDLKQMVAEVDQVGILLLLLLLH